MVNAQRRQRAFLVLLACLLLAALQPARALAVDSHAALVHVPEGFGAGVEYGIYPVADASEAFIGGFESSAVNLSDAGSAQALAAYAAANGIAPYSVQVSGDSGTCTFEGLEAGIYLLVGSKAADDEAVYEVAPALLRIYSADVEVEGKGSVTPVPQPGDTVDVSVVKAWDDSDNADGKRPTSVKVQLLCDGAAYDEAVLSAEGNWRFTWENLSADHEWAVLEAAVPDGYVVSLDRQGSVFTITNTAKTPLPSTGDSDGTTLPQTGQLWVPVFVMATAGVALVLAGVLVRGKERSKKRSGEHS